MNGQQMLYIDQYGGMEWAGSVKELREKCGGGRVFKIYVDKKDGSTVHCGYGIGKRWFNAFLPYQGAA